MSVTFTEEQLKEALAAYAEDQAENLQLEGDPPAFSESYKLRRRQIIEYAATGNPGVFRQKKPRRALRSALLVAVCAVLVCGVIVVSSPAAYAAVRSWSLNIYNKVVDYTFSHSDKDHAVIICTPASLPEGFETAETYHSGYYTRKVYKSAETGDFIRFEYRRPTEAQKSKIAKRAQSAEKVYTSTGVEMNLTDSGNHRNLFWYDPDRDLAYYVESSLGAEALAAVFSDIQLRLPLYEPTWLPEGYEVADVDSSYPFYDVVYSNGDEYFDVYYDCSDLAETDLVFVVSPNEEAVTTETVSIQGKEGFFHPHNDERDGGDLIIIDEKNNLVYMIESNIDKQSIVRIGESIEFKETEW